MNDKKQLDKEAYLAAAGNCFLAASINIKDASVSAGCNRKDKWSVSISPTKIEIIREHLKEAEDFKARGLKFLEMAEQLEKE